MKEVVIFIVLLWAFPFSGNCSDSLFQEGVQELVNGDYEVAQRIFQEDIYKAPSISNYYNLGIASGKLGDWNKAKWAFESALKYEPLNEDAQYNAKFATQKISNSKAWTNPYTFGEQAIIGFGSIAWLVLTILFSLSIGLFLYVIFRKNNKNTSFIKWSLRLIIPSVLLFIISFYCFYSINNHFDQPRFAILKKSTSKFYISPNGVESNDEIDGGSRFEIVKYTEDSTWVQLKLPTNNILWIQQEKVYSF